MKFIKMHGLGNDFLVIDATLEKTSIAGTRIQSLADRRTGVGFDQLLILEESTDDAYDFIYRIFNASGEEVEQCGNGARCVAHYIFTEKLPHKEKISLKTKTGKIELQKVSTGIIKVNMGSPKFAPASLPFLMDQEQKLYKLSLNEDLIEFGAVSLGNPHVVIKVPDISQAPVQHIGQLLQQHPCFPKQVNVGFMQVVSPDLIRLRVFERGVGETRACGSGACAAVVVGRLSYKLAPDVQVELPGGSLKVSWQPPRGDVYMTGPAKIVFKGELADLA